MHYKNKKSQKGFTLVEVIVVAVIVAALAAVAVPLYLSYIESSRENSAANAAGSAASFCGACINSGGTVGDSLNTSGGGKLGCSTNSATLVVPDKVVLKLVSSPARGVEGHHVDADSGKGRTTFNY